MRRVSSAAFLALALLFSCASLRHVAPAKVADSVRIEIVRREEVVTDTIYVEIPFQKESVIRPDSSFLVNDYAQSEARILGSGELYHSLETLAQQIQEPISMSVEVCDSVIFRQRTVTHIVERERELTPWQRFQIKCFYYLVAIFMIFVACRFL